MSQYVNILRRSCNHLCESRKPEKKYKKIFEKSYSKSKDFLLSYIENVIIVGIYFEGLEKTAQLCAARG